MTVNEFDFFKDSELTNLWSERSTRLTKEQAKYISLDTPSGNQQQLFNVGEIVQTNEQAIFKAGIKWKVLEVWKENGHCRYKLISVGLKHNQTAVLCQRELSKVMEK